MLSLKRKGKELSNCPTLNLSFPNGWNDPLITPLGGGQGEARPRGWGREGGGGEAVRTYAKEAT